jgi:hypothetical protein
MSRVGIGLGIALEVWLLVGCGGGEGGKDALIAEAAADADVKDGPAPAADAPTGWGPRLMAYPGQWAVGSHVALAYDDRLWVMGGLRALSSSSERNDVWFTRDGASWMLATEHAGWSPRSMFAAAVFQGEMWVIDGARLGDVWRSADGVTWTKVDGNPFPPRYAHQVAVFHDRLFIIAGYGVTGASIGDVWSSADGKTWKQETALAEFGVRHGATAFVFDDRLWLAGGYGNGPMADVWSSADGAHWTLVTAAPAFPRRRGAAGVVFGGRMWILGGDGVPSSHPLLDAWSSSDGVLWNLEPQGPWTNPIYDLTATSFAGAIWVISGDGVWKTNAP